MTLNETVIFSPSDFNQRVNVVEKNITLREGQNTLKVLLSGTPRGQITIQITQEVEAITGRRQQKVKVGRPRKEQI